MSEAEYKQALPRGHLLRDYRLLDVLGVGGFGVTYVAFHQGLQEKVAVKEYLPNEFAVRDGVTVQAKSNADLESFEWGLDRFVEEARTLARFKHANVVRVRDYFKDNNTAYIVMDYEEGEALDVLLDRLGSLTPAQLASLLLPLVDGLRQVHGRVSCTGTINPQHLRAPPTSRRCCWISAPPASRSGASPAT